MRKIMRFKIVILLIFSFGLLIISCKKTIFETRFRLSKTSKRPYDIKFFYDKVQQSSIELHEITASLKNGILDELNDSTNNIYMIVSPQFYPNANEIYRIKYFASKGQTVFISSFNFSDELIDSLYYRSEKVNMNLGFPPHLTRKSWHINYKEYDGNVTEYKYPGHFPVISNFKSIHEFSNNTTSNIDTLITDSFKNNVMLRINCGNGLIYLCNNPIIFSNYFLLHKKNYQFFNQIASELNLENSHVYWDDYFRKRTRIPQNDDSEDYDENDPGDTRFFEVISENPPLSWAFYTFLIAVVLFVLNYFRRIQMPVPVQKSLKNNTEAYINVVSGLYWQKQNHKLIAEKIIHQFFEYLSSQYHIYSKDFVESEIPKISQKTGRSVRLLKEINNSIEFVRNSKEIEQHSLINLYHKVNEFYVG